MNKKQYLFLLLVLVVAFWFIYQQQASSSPVRSVTATSTKTGALALYPNPMLTPGEVLTTDASVVCVKGYAGSVRNVPVSEKRQVYNEYATAYPQPQGTYEVDHFISLELGGSNDIKNLWPEPASPTPGFHQKDVVENYLHEQVCSGKLPLATAQQEIANDWYAVYLQIK